MRLAAITMIMMMAVMVGCGHYQGEWKIGEKPHFRFRESVLVVNNLKYEVVVIYRSSWGEERRERFSPGQEGMLTGLREDEYLTAQVLKNGSVIGTATKQVSSPRGEGPDHWRITRYRSLR